MNLQCIICMEIYTSLDEIIITPCGHLFHKVCLTDWFQMQPNCAQCRAPCSSINLIRVYLNSATDSEVHLARNCNVETINEELEMTKTNLQTLQDDLHSCNSIIIELKTIIASYEEYERLEQQKLEQAIEKFEKCEDELKKTKSEIEKLKISQLSIDISNPSSLSLTEDKSFENIASLKKELELLKLQKQVVEDELKKSKDEIAQMKCITQALALKNLSIYSHQDARPRQNDQSDVKNQPTKSNSENYIRNPSNQNKSRQSYQDPRPRQQNDHPVVKNEQTKTLGTLIDGLGIRNPSNKSRQRYNKKNPRNDNRNFNNTKPKEKENETPGCNMTNLDEPWW